MSHIHDEDIYVSVTDGARGKLYYVSKGFVFLSVYSVGRGIVHVGVMLRVVERGDGHGHGAGAAAGVRSRGGALPLRPQCWVLHLPPHQLRERRSAVQGLRTGILCLQTQGKQELFQWK